MEYPVIPEEKRIELLKHPEGKVDFVLDTDTYNEIDDQFAVVYALLSKETLNVKALYAAPFHNKNSKGPEDGMEKSYDEILRLLDRLNVDPEGFVFKGSKSWIQEDMKPVDSPAAQHLVELANHANKGPLYVGVIGAPTNVSSAILMDPSIIDKIVVLWLGGHPQYWPNTVEFNCQQDIPASQVLFDSGVPLVRFPCQNCVSALRTTESEMAKYVKGKGAIGDYLYEIFVDYQPGGGLNKAWSKVILDIVVVAWLVDPRMAPTQLVHSPILSAYP
jgi:purine nucleosidase